MKKESNTKLVLTLFLNNDIYQEETITLRVEIAKDREDGDMLLPGDAKLLESRGLRISGGRMSAGQKQARAKQVTSMGF